MADSVHVAKLPEPERPEIPDTLKIEGAPNIRLTANEMRILKAETGRTTTELMSEAAEEEDRMQTMAWLEARRRGHDVTWEEAGDIGLEFSGERPDPTSAEPSTP